MATSPSSPSSPSSTSTPSSFPPSASPTTSSTSQNASSSSLPQSTGYTPGESGSIRIRNFFSLITGQMNDEGKAQYKRDADRRHEKTHCERCEKHRDFLLAYSPVVRFMRENIQRLGGDINASNIWCRRCDIRQSGGFDPQFGIVLCANELRNRGHVEDTLTHEMIHAHDHLRFRVDWHRNLRHAACAEVRASSLSGECRWAREFFARNQWRVAQHHQACVRRRAALSLAGRPEVRDDVQAARLVNEVWESCFNDTRPFDEIYR